MHFGLCAICGTNKYTTSISPSTCVKSYINNLCFLVEDKLHMFPNPNKYGARFYKWVSAAGNQLHSMDRDYIYNNRRICRKHFETKYHNRNDKLNRLAVPTLFLLKARTPIVDHDYAESSHSNPTVEGSSSITSEVPSSNVEVIAPTVEHDHVESSHSNPTLEGSSRITIDVPSSHIEDVILSIEVQSGPSITQSIPLWVPVLHSVHQESNQQMEPIVLVHGGAGDIPDSRVEGKLLGIKGAARRGHRVLMAGGSVVDAVEAAVVHMEDLPAFNAGYGSVLNLNGELEMEASIQRGSDLNAGAVTLVRDFPNPIRIARKVMEDTPHSLLGGDGMKSFALNSGFKTVPSTNLISQQAREALESFRRSKIIGVTEIGDDKIGDVGTVGAVAIDACGRIAVATSTGGMSGKFAGRIGDTPQIGSGTYADDRIGGVSTTGHGESILRYCLAHAIIKLMESGMSAQDATKEAVVGMTSRLNNTAGAITLSKSGDVGVYFSSKRMAWCYVKGDEMRFGIENGQDVLEIKK